MQKATLIEQLNSLYEGPNWIGVSFKPVLKGVTAALAFRQPPGGRHSIAEIVKHMMAWKALGVRQLKGEGKASISQAATFSLKRYATADEQAWKQLLQDYDKTHRQLIAALRTATQQQLQQKAAKRSYSLAYLADGLMLHESYHLGQLAFVKKQLQQLATAG